MPFLGLGSEAALRAIAQQLPEGLFTTDPAGRITFWNQAAQRITGWSPEEALGRDCSLLAGDAVSGCFCGEGPIRCGLATQGRTSKTCTLRAKDGRLLSVVKNAVTLLAPDGRPVGALETFTAVEASSQPPACERPVSLPSAPGPGGMVGSHPVMQDLYATINLVARSEATVMILGESGAGKERVAEAIHRGSPRAAGPFVRVSCAALEEKALACELFGDVADGATCAGADRPGRFAEARGGTLLLDEVADITPAVQAKLLRVIERRELDRLGAAPVPVDVRLLCATHRNLKAMVEAGRFRADLYFRLAVFPVRVPPLRERLDDLPLLALALLARLGERGGPRGLRVSPAALAVLQAYAWPGNVRELGNTLEFAALHAGTGAIDVEHLPAELREPVPTARQPAAEERAGRRAGPLDVAEILAMVERCGGNRAEAARRLGISRVTLWKRLKPRG
jgi:DNA-binding NtrC family response regulator